LIVTPRHPRLPVLEADLILHHVGNITRNISRDFETFAPMPEHLQRYCRGCKCTVDEVEFHHQGQQYKQCERCRARLHHRRRSDKTVVCQCGRQVLETSLRDHRRTLYHEQQMALLIQNKQQTAQNEPENKSPEQAPRKAAIDHPKPVVAAQAQRAATVHVKPLAACQAKPANANQAMPAAPVDVKPATPAQVRTATAGQVVAAAAGPTVGQTKSVATGRAESVAARVKPAARPADAVPASGMNKAKEPPAQASRSSALKAPAMPVSMTPASHLLAKLKQMEARP
jgi:hypothetical protein